MLLLFGFLFYLHCVRSLVSFDPDSFEIKLNGSVVMEATSTLNFIEGNSYGLECFYKANRTIPVVWEINTIEPQTIVQNSTLVIQNISRSQLKSVSCSTKKIYNAAYIHFTVYIQYPPSTPQISGPSVVTRTTSFKLTCEVDSEPPPTIWWTVKSPYNTPILSEDMSEICMNVTGIEDVDIFCMAYNIMFTTPVNGTATGPEPLQKSLVSALHHVIVEDDSNNRHREEHCMSFPAWSSTTGQLCANLTGYTSQSAVVICYGECDKATAVNGNNDSRATTESVNNGDELASERDNKGGQLVTESGCSGSLIAVAVIGWILAVVLMLMLGLLLLPVRRKWTRCNILHTRRRQNNPNKQSSLICPSNGFKPEQNEQPKHKNHSLDKGKSSDKDNQSTVPTISMNAMPQEKHPLPEYMEVEIPESDENTKEAIDEDYEDVDPNATGATRERYDVMEQGTSINSYGVSIDSQEKRESDEDDIK